ncbi:MAG: prepilin-type N-terminal cleavage/methylation domain-containing protein [Planctomycetes bacterium]|nr:prepilin-type N-terminal cleavage/methylation domain-containing protein [Planctomycetota bacterium]
MKRATHNRGFTLMELLVVIAIIALLVTVMVPVILGFMKGRGLSMAGNNIGGFIAFARSEAMNARQPHVIVCFSESELIDESGPIKLYAGPGMAVYRINKTPGPDEIEINYLKQLDFTDAIGGDVNFSNRWIGESPKGPIQPYLTDGANAKFAGKYKIVVLPDGRLIIPEDKPGYILDTAETMNLNTDLALTDGERFVYLDINPATGGVKRSNVLDREETGETQ